VVFLHNTKGTLADTPTLTGNGITWTTIDTQLFRGAGHDLSRLTLLAGFHASPSAGTVVIDFAGTQTACSWSFHEIAGADVSGTVANAFVQIVKANLTSNNTTLSTTLAAFASATNLALAGFGVAVTEAITHDANYTEQSDITEDTCCTLVESLEGNSDLSPSASWTTTNRAGVIAVEVREAGAPAATGHKNMLLLGVG
jgi:hypothetical protein